MGRIRHYRTAWSRHHRSAGFGIHSPHAFNFVLNVLGERLPYYCYDELAQLRQAVVGTACPPLRASRVVSNKHMRMLFRITNCFNPAAILEIGAQTGLAAASMMAVSSRSRLWLSEPHADRSPVLAQVLMPMLERVSICSDQQLALAEYHDFIGKNGADAFVLVNHVAHEHDLQPLAQWLCQAVQGQAVVVLRNLNHHAPMRSLLEQLREKMPHGQLFTNDKLAVIVANPKLQREDFSLWF